MVKLYLDIDGVLLTAKHTQAAPGVGPFVDFITTHFACFWLTTHCQGESAPALRYLSQFLAPATVAQLAGAVQPTTWDTLKTEAIAMSSNFYWLDDQPLTAEIACLRAQGLEHRLLVVTHDGENTLVALQEALRQLLTDPA